MTNSSKPGDKVKVIYRDTLDDVCKARYDVKLSGRICASAWSYTTLKFTHEFSCIELVLAPAKVNFCPAKVLFDR